MNIADVKINERYTYHPPKEREDDNMHWLVVVESIDVRRKRVRIRFAPNGARQKTCLRVSPERLTVQGEIHLNHPTEFMPPVSDGGN